MSPISAQGVVSRPCRVCSAPIVDEQRFCGVCGAGVDFGGDAGEGEGGVADPLVGRVVADRYRMLRCIGRGGMGVVYEVEHVHIGKRLAMKLLHGDLAGDPGTIRRLRREAEAASRLSDSSTVQVFDFGTSDGLAYLVMELVEGEDLGQILRLEGRLSFARVARLVIDVCGSLAEAHALGIVHRDLKPENVMVVRGSMGERAKVLDFGLAMLRASANQSISRTGSIVGTPHYMAPEQIRAEDVDARVDVYALGGLLYRAVTGAPPFTGDSAIVVLTKHMSEPVVPPSQRAPDLEPGVDRIILRCLEKSPRDRYAGVAELADDLATWLRDRGLLDEVKHREVTATHRVDVIATRHDVDAYEARLRRRSRASNVAIGLSLVAALAIGGFLAFRGAKPVADRAREAEPNQTPATATLLARGHGIAGKLGRRIDTARGDIDVYRLERRSSADRSALRARVSPIPNIDLVLELFREGDDEPILRADATGVGGDEGFVGFPIGTGSYLLVVRERWVSGVYPIENVSDSYRLVWDEAPSVDGEIDDSRETARSIEPGVAMRGTIGWKDDIDLVCAEGVGPGRWTVTPGPDANVAIALDSADTPPTLVDGSGVGGAESVSVGPASPLSCLRIVRVESPAGDPRPLEAAYGVLLVRAR